MAEYDDHKRLSNLERITAELRVQNEKATDEIHEVKSALENLALEVRRFMSAYGKTNHSVLASYAGLVLAIGALAFSPFRSDLARLENAHYRLEERIIKQHEGLEGSWRAELARVENRLGLFESWSATHERDVSALNATQSERIDSLFERVKSSEERSRREADKLHSMEAVLSKQGVIIERVESEQGRRTARVYEKEQGQ